MITLTLPAPHLAHIQATRPRCVGVVAKFPNEPDPSGWRIGVEYKPGVYGLAHNDGAIASMHSPFGPPGSRVRLNGAWTGDSIELTISRSELRQLSEIDEETARAMGFSWPETLIGYGKEPQLKARDFYAEHYPGAEWLWLGWEE